MFAPLRGTAASDHLDLIRGLAAFAVLFFHLRGTFFVDLGPGVHPALSVFYFLTVLGHPAVMVFFVLSGFLVGASVLRAWNERRWQWRSYLIARLTRLYLVLIPALVLGLIWDRSGLALFGSHGIYAGAVANASINGPIAPRLGLLTMLGNALFLQSILTTSFGSNGPLWALSYEFWYYILFPLLLIVLWDERPMARIAALVAAPCVMLFVGSTISRCFVIWLAGVAVNFLPFFKLARPKLLIGIGLAIFWAAMAASWIEPPILENSYVRELLAGAATAILIYAVVQDRAPSRNGLYARIARRLAGFSYALYVLQMPCIVFFKALILPDRRWAVGPFGLLACAALVCAIVLYSALVAHFTEERNERVRLRVTAIVSRIFDRGAAA